MLLGWVDQDIPFHFRILIRSAQVVVRTVANPTILRTRAAGLPRSQRVSHAQADEEFLDELRLELCCVHVLGLADGMRRRSALRAEPNEPSVPALLIRRGIFR